jgi:serine/threonine-protein kinase
VNVHANDQQRLREIFCAVRQQATEHEKSQLLDQLCVGNASLRKQVEQLLAAASSASPVDRIGAMLNPTELEFNSAPEQSPRIDITSHPWIGPYKLLEQIGEGGMGTVFMAVQSQPIKRKVALKIIKPGMDTGQVIARFEVERQALAMMNHPNIAKVLDAGATEAGRPYFVMELVLGIPITEFCDLHKLDLRQRLEMFSTVCQALQHAHQKGIIHRDLKPSNILVELQDVTPVPKVIDFGVAKPIHQSLTERTLHTGFAQMIGTPLYMSPEQTQLSSLDVDTRSDVYSLGVLLYEMLTGSTPFDRGHTETSRIR